jgi:hypothetical protein
MSSEAKAREWWAYFRAGRPKDAELSEKRMFTPQNPLERKLFGNDVVELHLIEANPTTLHAKEMRVLLGRVAEMSVREPGVKGLDVVHAIDALLSKISDAEAGGESK